MAGEVVEKSILIVVVVVVVCNDNVNKRASLSPQ